jgi:hypothetical protein
MVHVRIAGDDEDVELVPPAQGHLLARGRQKPRARILLSTELEEGLGGQRHDGSRNMARKCAAGKGWPTIRERRRLLRGILLEMRRLVLALVVPMALIGAVALPAPAQAQNTFASSPVALARELVLRARRLDESATIDERAATALAAELPAKRSAAKVAREVANKATIDSKPALEARAEDLETDVIVTDAEITARRNAAAEDRRMAKDLRARAVRLAQGNEAELRKLRPRSHQSDIF